MSEDWKPPVEVPLRGVKSHFIRAPDGDIKCWAGTRNMWIGSKVEAETLAASMGPGHTIHPMTGFR
jgi:hypothetical protein